MSSSRWYLKRDGLQVKVERQGQVSGVEAQNVGVPHGQWERL